MVTFDDVQNNPEIQALIREAGHVLSVMNYTEHGLRHVSYVARTAHMILNKLGYDEKMCELAKIAGYIHDVGNMINRKNHGITAATLCYPILRDGAGRRVRNLRRNRQPRRGDRLGHQSHRRGFDHRRQVGRPSHARQEDIAAF